MTTLRDFIGEHRDEILAPTVAEQRAKGKTLSTFWNRPVHEYASKTLISVRPETPLVEVLDLLLERDITALPVVDDSGELKGILSTTDLLREARIDVSAPGELARIMPLEITKWAKVVKASGLKPE